jgi:hypothetical protein
MVCPKECENENSMFSFAFDSRYSMEDIVASPIAAARRNWRNRLTSRLPLFFLGAFVLAGLAAPPPARAQAAVEYGGSAASVSTVASSRPNVFSPGGIPKPNMGLFLAKPKGTPPEVINREWFAKQAGKQGGELTVTVVPPGARLWVDGKYVGQLPLSLTLPPGKHQLSLVGTREQATKRELEIQPGKKQQLTVDLKETYPATVSIRVFGNHPH